MCLRVKPSEQHRPGGAFDAYELKMVPSGEAVKRAAGTRTFDLAFEPSIDRQVDRALMKAVGMLSNPHSKAYDIAPPRLRI